MSFVYGRYFRWGYRGLSPRGRGWGWCDLGGGVVPGVQCGLWPRLADWQHSSLCIIKSHITPDDSSCCPLPCVQINKLGHVWLIDNIPDSANSASTNHLAWSPKAPFSWEPLKTKSDPPATVGKATLNFESGFIRVQSQLVMWHSSEEFIYSFN